MVEGVTGWRSILDLLGFPNHNIIAAITVRRVDFNKGLLSVHSRKNGGEIGAKYRQNSWNDIIYIYLQYLHLYANSFERHYNIECFTPLYLVFFIK